MVETLGNILGAIIDAGVTVLQWTLATEWSRSHGRLNGRSW